MLKLFCDLCDTKISDRSDEPMAIIEIKETKYRGHNEFLTDMHCEETTKYLCPKCKIKMHQFMNFKFKEVSFNGDKIEY